MKLRNKFLLAVAILFILATVAIVTAGVTFFVTMAVLDAWWQEYHNTQQKELANFYRIQLNQQRQRLAEEYQERLEAIQAEHRSELGQERLYWLERVWIIYYNSCNLFTRNQFSSCLESARKGYIEGRHDNVKPAPYWDWDYVQFGKYLESG